MAETLPEDIVYLGMSMGVLPAQHLAQTRPGARGAVLLHGAVSVTEFSPAWPTHVPVQVHAMDVDPEFIDSGDIDAAMALVTQAEDGNLFFYPGKGHMFTDSSLDDTTPKRPRWCCAACWPCWRSWMGRPLHLPIRRQCLSNRCSTILQVVPPPAVIRRHK